MTLSTIEKEDKSQNEYKLIPITYIAKIFEKSYSEETNLANIIFSKDTIKKLYKKDFTAQNSSDTFSMELNNFPIDKPCDIIVTAVTNEDSSDMFYYGLIKNPFGNPTGNNGNKVLVIILIIIILGITCAFAILFYRMKKENKDLNDKINRMSGYNIVTDDNTENLNYKAQT